MRQLVIRWLIRWAIVVVLWLAFVENSSVPELIAAAMIGIATATVVELVLAQSDLRFAATWRDALLLCRRVPIPAVRAAFRVLALLPSASRESGLFRSIPFDPGGDDPHSVARRVFVIAGVSVAPTAYVVEIDRKRQELLLHQILPSQPAPGSGDRRWPI